MHGNVWEWVQGRYGPYIEEPQTDPLEPGGISFPAMRGGTCRDSAKNLRSAARQAYLYPNSPHPQERRIEGKWPTTPQPQGPVSRDTFVIGARILRMENDH